MLDSSRDRPEASTPDPPPSTLPLRPSTPCGTPAPQTTHRNFDPGSSATDAIQTTTAGSDGSSPGPRGTPAPLLWHLHSAATLLPATRAPERTNPPALHRAACPARSPPRAAYSPRQRYLFSPPPPVHQERSPQSSECLWSCC